MPEETAWQGQSLPNSAGSLVGKDAPADIQLAGVSREKLLTLNDCNSEFSRAIANGPEPLPKP